MEEDYRNVFDFIEDWKVQWNLPRDEDNHDQLDEERMIHVRFLTSNKLRTWAHFRFGRIEAERKLETFKSVDLYTFFSADDPRYEVTRRSMHRIEQNDALMPPAHILESMKKIGIAIELIRPGRGSLQTISKMIGVPPEQ